MLFTSEFVKFLKMLFLNFIPIFFSDSLSFYKCLNLLYKEHSLIHFFFMSKIRNQKQRQFQTKNCQQLLPLIWEKQSQFQKTNCLRIARRKKRDRRNRQRKNPKSTEQVSFLHFVLIHRAEYFKF